MNTYTNIADAAAARHRLSAELNHHLAASEAETKRLRAAIQAADDAVAVGGAGFDLERIQIAEAVLFVEGQYAKAGADRASVVRDAIAQIATGEKQGYRGLWEERFATKNYAHWTGQRSDAAYGCGPKHGHIVFAIGLRPEVRKRDVRELTDSERDACVYYLTNLEAIQTKVVSAAA